MILNWLTYDRLPDRPLSLQDTEPGTHKKAHAHWGVFHLLVTYNMQEFKDGTRFYLVYLNCPNADSRETITLTKVRGYLIDAINAAENALFSKGYDMPAGNAVDAADHTSRNAFQPGKYRHFKGKEYKLLDIATDSETGEVMVVYRALYGDGTLWVRPAAMWNEIVERPGYTGPRFVKVED